MDDFDSSETTRLGTDARLGAILGALDKHHAHAELFIACRRLQGAVDTTRLAEWTRRGHQLGNHSFSHRYLGKDLSAEDAIADITRCHDMLVKLPGYEKRFRYPYLAEGDTAEKRDRVHAWLSQQGFSLGAVTIDASDWYIDKRLIERLKKDPNADVTPYRDYYLKHIWERAQYYDGLSQALYGRSVKHTLLVHFNLLNALFLDDVLTMLESHGWKVVDAKTAFADEVFAKPVPSMPSGQSVLWGNAKLRGRADLRFPGEDGEYEKAAMDALGL